MGFDTVITNEKTGEVVLKGNAVPSEVYIPPASPKVHIRSKDKLYAKGLEGENKISYKMNQR